VRRGLIIAALALHCGSADPHKPALDVVADQITFKSVEALGPHHLLATIEQQSVWTDGNTESHEETVELAWNDWDSFHLRRVVRGSAVGETIMDQGRSYHRGQGPHWVQEFDSEPARLRVRTSWSVWSTAMEVFSARIDLVEMEQSIVDGRSARRYQVSLAPRPQGQRIRHGGMKPISITGEVWIDQATAVRLAADVTAKVDLKGMRRTIQLHLRRSHVGEQQTIEPPSASVKTPAQALRERLEQTPPSPPNRPTRP
jgi:hypothetical protein